jgi:DNA-binding transcriptional MerR regulator
VDELARAAGMTTKALRHYDQLGLFRPDWVDEGNGYRWYGADRSCTWPTPLGTTGRRSARP